MPGTMLAGEKAACSTSAKKFSGFRLSSQYADLDQRIVRLRPHLGEVEGVDAGVLRACASVITWMNSVQRGKSPRSMLRRGRAGGSRDRWPMSAAASRVGQVLDALLGAEVELDPDPLVGCALIRLKVWLPKPCMCRIALRNAAVAHDDGDLVQRLGQQRPEIPVVVG